MFTDLPYFNQISKGKHKLANDIKQLFVSEVPKELTLLHEAIEKKDYENIKELSFKLKSSVSIVGLDNLTPLLNTIEEKSASNVDIEHIGEMFKDVRSVCAIAIQELEST